MLTPEEIARLVGAGIAAARGPKRPANEARIHTSRLKMENPEKFDGKSSTTFNQWWESVTMYLGFNPETVNQQKIAWVGTLLTDTALVWHLHRYRELQDNNTWANYLAAIWTEYRNEREAANAQLKLGQLRYQGSIRTYMTDLRALNNFAQATGEVLKEKVNLAMSSDIVRMRFAHYLGEFEDDKGFLQATYQAGLQVERMKALEKIREGTRTQKPQDEKKDGQSKGSFDNTRKGKETDRPPRGSTEQQPRKPQDWWGGKDHWGSKEGALKVIPAKEQEEYGLSHDDCWRCGRPGHRTFE